MEENVKSFPLEFGELDMRRSSPRGSKGGPAYFLSLSVQNVRCFKEEQILDFSDGAGRPAQWTILLGENGVGKTTVLQTLAALQPTQFVHRELKHLFYLPIGSGNLGALNFITSVIFSDPSLAGEPRMLSTVHTGEKLSRSTGRATVIRDLGIERTGGNMQLRAIASPSQQSKIKNLVCYGYGASRRMGEASLSNEVGTNPSESLFSDSVELLNAEEWLLQADYAASKPSRVQERARKRRDQIVELLVRLLPDTTAIRFVQPTSVSLKPSVQLRTPYGWVNVKQLSLGYRTSIAWMVDLASRMFERYPSSKDPLAEPAVVLVDEIDLHLHPAWQRSMMTHLSSIFVNTQFIVSAHSPLVVQAAPDANVILLKRSGGQVIAENDVSNVRGWRVDQILTSDLFGLPSPRPPEFDDILLERRQLLSQPALTKTEETRIEEIERTLAGLPIGDTPEDRYATDLMRRIVETEQKREIQK